MRKLSKLFIGIALAISCVICCIGTSAFAANVDPIVPMWDNVNRISCSISFNGTSGRVICDITAVPGTDSIEGTLTLYEDNVEIEVWNIDVTQSYVTILDRFSGISGSTYKLVLDVDVYYNGTSEPIYVTSTEVCE